MKIIFLCAQTLDLFQIEVLRTFFDSSKHTILCCVLDTARPGLLSRLIYNLKRGRGGYIIVMALQTLFKNFAPSEPAEDYFRSKNIPVILTDNISSEKTLHELKKLQPDLLALLSGFGILKAAVLEVPRYGVISYHHGDMRKYRGQPPGFWELYNGEREMGMTVQRLNIGLDCGEPIVEKRLKIQGNETWKSLQKKAAEQSTGMMIEAVDLIEQGSLLERIAEYGQIYTLPNLREWILLNLKLAFRRFGRF